MTNNNSSTNNQTAINATKALVAATLNTQGALIEHDARVSGMRQPWLAASEYYDWAGAIAAMSADEFFAFAMEHYNKIVELVQFGRDWQVEIGEAA